MFVESKSHQALITRWEAVSLSMVIIVLHILSIGLLLKKTVNTPAETYQSAQEHVGSSVTIDLTSSNIAAEASPGKSEPQIKSDSFPVKKTEPQQTEVDKVAITHREGLC